MGGEGGWKGLLGLGRPRDASSRPPASLQSVGLVGGKAGAPRRRAEGVRGLRKCGRDQVPVRFRASFVLPSVAAQQQAARLSALFSGTLAVIQ